MLHTCSRRSGSPRPTRAASWEGGSTRLVKGQHRAQCLAAVQQVKGLVDAVKLHLVGDVLVQQRATCHVLLNQLWHLLVDASVGGCMVSTKWGNDPGGGCKPADPSSFPPPHTHSSAHARSLTAGRDFQPPSAVPFHWRPVTSWKGRVLISCPAAATPITTLWPHPLCAHSSAALITVVLPMHSNLWQG